MRKESDSALAWLRRNWGLKNMPVFEHFRRSQTLTLTLTQPTTYHGRRRQTSQTSTENAASNRDAPIPTRSQRTRLHQRRWRDQNQDQRRREIFGDQSRSRIFEGRPQICFRNSSRSRAGSRKAGQGAKR